MEEKNLFRPEEAFFVIESDCLEQVAENRQVILFTCQSREKQLQKN